MTMGNKIVTEADRKATKPLPGAPRIKAAGGQKRSLERGSHIRSKKNPASARTKADTGTPACLQQAASEAPAHTRCFTSWEGRG